MKHTPWSSRRATISKSYILYLFVFFSFSKSFCIYFFLAAVADVVEFLRFVSRYSACRVPCALPTLRSPVEWKLNAAPEQPSWRSECHWHHTQARRNHRHTEQTTSSTSAGGGVDSCLGQCDLSIRVRLAECARSNEIVAYFWAQAENVYTASGAEQLILLYRQY